MGNLFFLQVPEWQKVAVVVTTCTLSTFCILFKISSSNSYLFGKNVSFATRSSSTRSSKKSICYSRYGQIDYKKLTSKNFPVGS